MPVTDFFVPSTKNPPAKVKDGGLIKLVMSGAGVYNAKSGSIIYLPDGRAAARRIAHRLVCSLFDTAGFQPVDCGAAEQNVASLPERYVREYGASALRWLEVRDRTIRTWAWAADRDEAGAAADQVISAVASSVKIWLPSFNFVSDVMPENDFTSVGVCGTEKGALNALTGFKCGKCGQFYLPDSDFSSKELPVNFDKEEASLSEIHTPGAHTIPLLCEQLGLNVTDTLKAMLYTVDKPDGSHQLMFVMIRGDKDVSLKKLGAYVRANFPAGSSFRRAEAEEILDAFGEVAGFCGPVGVPENVHMVADKSIEGGKNFVVGGNRPDYHRTGCCWGRDFKPPVADLMLFEEKTPCPECGEKLEEAWLRRICTVKTFNIEANGGHALACRDRDGVHTWPCICEAEISVDAMMLALFESGLIEKTL